MRRLNVLSTRQVSDSASQLEDAVIGAGTQLHLLHRSLEQIGAGFVYRAEFADFGRPHIGVGLERCVFEPFSLNGTSRLDPFPDLRAGFAGRRDWLLSFSKGTRGTST